LLTFYLCTFALYFYSLGILYGYIAPLAFVLILKITKEAYDDYQRMLKDQEANSDKYMYKNFNIRILNHSYRNQIQSGDIKIGDIIEIQAN
jgi:phospholipid-translocating ATPase